VTRDVDFRLEKVVSINVSGHKYGLVYPGVGWVIWRSPESDTGIDQTILVTRDVDGNHLFQAEVPLKIRLDEWNWCSTSTI
jgi:hypothetical protein